METDAEQKVRKASPRPGANGAARGDREQLGQLGDGTNLPKHEQACSCLANHEQAWPTTNNVGQPRTTHDQLAQPSPNVFPDFCPFSTCSRSPLKKKGLEMARGRLFELTFSLAGCATAALAASPIRSAMRRALPGKSTRQGPPAGRDV